MKSNVTRMGANGRVVIPSEVREALRLKRGQPLIVVVDDGKILLLTVPEAIRRAQDMVRKYVKPGRSMVKELIRERREEARRE
jgi:AbrB family looped-hinge helix DNA binding protein